MFVKDLFELKTHRNPYIGNIFSHSDNSIFSFEHFLERKGFTHINSGAYGTVFSHPSLNYVIKISSGFDNYSYFVRLVQRAPNVHFPQFRGKLLHIQGKCVVRMEILQEVDMSLRRNLYKLWRCAISGTFSKQVFFSSLKFVCERDAEFASWTKENNTLMAAIGFLIEHCPERMDLHDQNYMQRADGTIVITDPYE